MQSPPHTDPSKSGWWGKTSFKVDCYLFFCFCFPTAFRQEEVLCPLYVSVPFGAPSHGACASVHHQRHHWSFPENERPSGMSAFVYLYSLLLPRSSLKHAKHSEQPQLNSSQRYLMLLGHKYSACDTERAESQCWYVSLVKLRSKQLEMKKEICLFSHWLNSFMRKAA